MAQNNSVNVVNLDFAQIKESLKTYLRNQTVLKDYDFDGSVLNTLLDVLAYNTHYQAFYSNMIANEMFLDSALVRSSIVSHAKHLGYLPSSIRASKALVNVVLNTPATSDTYIARGTEFVGTNLAGTRYKFVNLETVFAEAGDTTIGPFNLYEGTLRRITYIYNKDTKLGSYLIIPNDKADISTIKVNVYKSITDTTGIDDVWSYGGDYLTLEPSSKVYFLQERDAGIYELYFGDGILGQQPETGNVVSIEYLETNGSDGNGVVAFTKTDSAISSIAFQTEGDVTFGGSDRETTGSIKYNAPKFYQTGNRAVTENDYEALVYKKYPNVASVNVYGGETVVPPRYGTVFIAIKPSSGGLLTTSEKIDLENDIRKNNSIVTITPRVVDPDYIDLVLDSTVIYSPSTLSISPGVLKTLAISYIYGYSAVNVEQFGRNFYYSKLAEGINNIHKSVLGVYSKIKMRKASDISTIRASRSFSFNFGNALYHPHDGHIFVVSSNTFAHLDESGNLQFECSVRDDGFGNLNVVRQNQDKLDEYILTYPSVGVVDYSTGVVTLNSKFQPSSGVIETTAFPIIITAEPDTTNIYANENQILRINPLYTDSVKVSVVSDTSAEATAAIR